jgi:predicted O-methyltransferase YrrM
VVSHGTFTRDWFTANIRNWHPLTDRLSGGNAQILEVGSFEGLSTCYLLWRLPRAELTCIDTFAGSPEHDSLELGDSLEATFDANIALVDSTRVSKIVGDSKRALLDLLENERTFDFIYVDGSHAGLDVIVDAALSWRLLALGGVLVFDDYKWAKLGPDPLLRPGPAIDAFASLVKSKHELVLTGGQLGLLKTLD